MKKLPYKNVFVVVQINNNIKKIYFDEVINYKKYSDPDFYEHKKCMLEIAIVEDKSAEKLFMLLAQAYLNSMKVIQEFKSISNSSCFSSSDLCVTLIVDMHVKADRSGTIQIDTWAHDENSDAFNLIGKYASNATMRKFIESLSVEQQDLLFDLA